MPNFYTMLGNNWVVNHSSVTTVLEIQAAYITQMVEAMRNHGIPKLEVKRPAAEAYDAWIERELKRTTWNRVANYWRKEGNGRIFTHYPGTVLRMWWQNLWPVWADYKGAERLAVRQRLRKFVFVLSLVAGALFTGKYMVDHQVLKRLNSEVTKLITHAVGLGQTLKTNLVGNK
jgi:hypothetical protein